MTEYSIRPLKKTQSDFLPTVIVNNSTKISLINWDKHIKYIIFVSTLCGKKANYSDNNVCDNNICDTKNKRRLLNFIF